MGRHRLIRAGALPVILLLAACTTGSGATTAPSTAASVAPPSASAAAASPSEAASPSGSATASEEYPLKVAAGSGTVTNYLTGANDLTLYVFKKDTADSGKSVCNGQCVTNWPPYLADDLDEVKADAAATGKLSIITRDDGKKQLAYNGMPLYYFAADKAAGDTKGAAIDNWAVAGA